MLAFGGLVVLALVAWGFYVLRYPRLYRLGVITFSLLALVSLFLVWFAAPRLAVSLFEADGGAWVQPLSQMFGAYVRVNLLLYGIIAASIVMVGLLALRAVSLLPRRE
jgi:hypothetical protein